MQGIGKQQQPVGHTGVFCRDHARLAAAVGLSGEIQRDTWSKLAQFMRSLPDAFAIALA